MLPQRKRSIQTVSVGRPPQNGAPGARQSVFQQAKARKGRGSSARLGEGKNLWITQRFPLTPRRISYIMLTTKWAWNSPFHIALSDRPADTSSRPLSLADAHPSAMKLQRKS